MTAQYPNKPLVSVIIPCYNHAHFLPEAVESVLVQSYSSVEIIVVDDGSADHTAEVAKSYPGVQYVYKENAGLSAARNTGIEKSKGEFLVFLDADDWLYEKALEINLSYFINNEELAFVSGAYNRIFAAENILKEEVQELSRDPYWHLLHGNFIGVPAAAMYRRWVFDKFRFDVSLQACEDYDMYLHIFRHYPVVHHTHKVAAYRTHASNMSANIPLMLYSSLKVLKRQKAMLKTEAEKEAYRRGKALWTDYYCDALYQKLKAGKSASFRSAIWLLLKHRPGWLCRHLLRMNIRPGIAYETK